MGINEIEDLIHEVGYKFCSLWQNSECVESWNNQYMTIDEKMAQIKKRLKALPTGTYLIKCRNSARGKVDSLELNHGNDKTTLSENPVEISPRLLENQTILKLSIENAELRKDNESLMAELDAIENELAECQAKLQELQESHVLSENREPTLMENAKSFVETLMEYGMPLLNQHWALKQQQLDIERAKIGMKRQTNNAPDPEKIKIRIIGEWVESKKGDQNLYNDLHEISAQSKSVDQFMQLLNDYNAELYAELSEQI